MSSQNSRPPRRDLVLRSKQGDDVALGELLEQHRDWLKAAAATGLNGRASSRLDASDVVQQTLLSAFNRIRQFKGTTSGEFFCWLQQIHQRNIQDALRRHVDARKRSTSTEIPFPHEESLPDFDASTPSQNAVRKERAKQLRQILELLPADQATAIQLRHLEGRTLVQLAEYFGRSKDSVASLLKRGLENLRKRIRENEFER